MQRSGWTLDNETDTTKWQNEMAQLYLYVVNKVLIFNIVASSYHKDNGLKVQMEEKVKKQFKAFYFQAAWLLVWDLS